jgi:hypothetical protein
MQTGSTHRAMLEPLHALNYSFGCDKVCARPSLFPCDRFCAADARVAANLPVCFETYDLGAQAGPL